jgi:uncharacterized repeat protein (TIGR02543 family)
MKNTRLAFLIFAFIGTLLLLTPGCRIFNGPDQSGDGGTPVSLSGQILVPANADAASSLRFAAAAQNVPAAGADVWIEELPDLPHQTADLQGRYTFAGIPAGNYHIVAGFRTAGNRLFKGRSQLLAAAMQTQELAVPIMLIAPARKTVYGILRDAGGNFVAPGTILTIWGERFAVGEAGRFISPALPENVATATMMIFSSPQNPAAFIPTVQLQFFSGEAPTTVELQLAGENSDLPQIGAELIARRNGQPVSTNNIISRNDIVELQVQLTNIAADSAGIIFEWDAGRGRFASPAGSQGAVSWVAPDISGIATVSVRISAPQRGSTALFIPLTVENTVVPPVYQIGFVSENIIISNTTQVHGEKIAEPAVPQRNGFTFAGWFRESQCINSWNFAADRITGNMSLYARWISGTVEPLTVAFATDSGSQVSSRTVIPGETVPEPAAPSKSGFLFDGWFKESECLNRWNFSTDVVNNNITLFAKWAPLPTSVTLSYSAGNGGTVSGTLAQTLTPGGNGTAVTAVAAAGYRFTSWSDGLTANPRTDTNVYTDRNIIANFVEVGAMVPGNNRYAWSENSGWINFAPDAGAVTARIAAPGSLAGFAWHENIGWISFAASATSRLHANTASDNWGVNIAQNGKLSGYAWSENAGWINFDSTHADAAINQQTGAITGRAWAENLGWISFSGTNYGVQFKNQ